MLHWSMLAQGVMIGRVRRDQKIFMPLTLASMRLVLRRRIMMYAIMLSPSGVGLYVIS